MASTEKNALSSTTGGFGFGPIWWSFGPLSYWKIAGLFGLQRSRSFRFKSISHKTNQGQDGRQVQAKKSLFFLSEKLIRELLNSFSLDLLRNAVSLLCRHNALGGLEARSLVLRHKSDESDEWTSLDSSL